MKERTDNMKKLLSMLGIVTIATVGANQTMAFTINKSQDIVTTDNIETYEQKYLNVKQIKQEDKVKCVSASIQMIFDYYNISLNTYTQNVIHSALGGTEGGAKVNKATADYINTVLKTATPKPKYSYLYSNLDKNFPNSQSNMIKLQKNVLDSLNKNLPVLLAYHDKTNDGKLVGHAVIITGINIVSSNYRETMYTYNDPKDGKVITVSAAELALNYFEFGGGIISPTWVN